MLIKYSKALSNTLVLVLSIATLFSVTINSFAQPPVSPGMPTQDVNVTNTESNPVPVTVENEDPVSVNVDSVSDPLPMTVENTDPISTILENDVSDPVPIFDVDRQTIDPFQESFSNLPFPAGSLSAKHAITTVPAGRRLVIEYVSVNVTLPNPSALSSVGVSIPDSHGDNTNHKLSFNPGVVDEFNDTTIYSIGSPTKLSAAPGRTVSIVTTRPRLSDGSLGDEGLIGATISGYLVPCGGDLGPCE